jgi:protein ImuA
MSMDRGWVNAILYGHTVIAMQAVLPLWPEPIQPLLPVPEVISASSAAALPPHIDAAIWRATELGAPVTDVVATGWACLDGELPGGGWPCRSVTEILQPQPSVCEWRLMGPALRSLVAAGLTIVVVGPPKRPHLPGLRHAGLDDHQFVWVQADTPAERLWTTEQLVKSNACGALLSWLPQARPEQLRRLQVCAQACGGPVILFRPEAAQHEASAAPLRVVAGFDLDWALRVHILKRKGPRHEGLLRLPSVPGGLESVLTPRLQTPSRLIANRERERADVLGGATPRQAVRRRVHA